MVMKKFPNKMIREAYESAKGKVFNKHSHDLTYIDQDGNTDYNHVALNWLEDNGVLGVELNRTRRVFEHRLVE
jgi:hypothetical protein